MIIFGKKKTIYLKITKLLRKKVKKNNYITYETNVTSIDNLVSAKFEIEKECDNIRQYILTFI